MSAAFLTLIVVAAPPAGSVDYHAIYPLARAEDRFTPDGVPIIPPGGNRWATLVDVPDVGPVAVVDSPNTPSDYLPQFAGTRILTRATKTEAVGGPEMMAKLAAHNARRRAIVEARAEANDHLFIVNWENHWVLSVRSAEPLDADAAAAANREAADGKSVFRLPDAAGGTPWRAGDVRVSVIPASPVKQVLFRSPNRAADPLRLGPGTARWGWGDRSREVWRLRDGAWTILREGTGTVRPTYL